MGGLELWGGHEGTVNRVGDRFFDQTPRSGHQDRISDLQLFAGLGMTALRYPVLWERVSPGDQQVRDFAWTDARLDELRRLGVRPIVGLTHHGSGPAHTNLLADSFAPGLANYAAAVAERYPWVQDWTPVNEPLTTARFSCLYGHWYPHTRDECACWLALVNQIDATRLAMREIRRVNPTARLVQTEDLGFCHATPALARQAAFENDRRWLTWDLLCGMVVPGHPLWERLAAHGLEDRLKTIADDPCPPDVIGVNHYLSSERFLDDRLELYPDEKRGGDDPNPHVNTCAVRTVADGPLGLESLLEQTWRRYDRTIAVTECHNGSTRDEQMRWFHEVWRSAERLREEGAPIEAVTAWSLLGAYDWNRLVVSEAGDYESGVFDMRGGAPRPTAMAGMLKALSSGQEPDNISLTASGWWRRPERFIGEPVRRLAAHQWQRRSPPPAPREGAPILIVGGTGALGRGLARACDLRNLSCILPPRRVLKLEDARSIDAALDRYQPAAVINAAGWNEIDRSQADPHGCLRVNAVGPANLAKACQRAGVPFVTMSSDMVFDGTKGAPYVESDGVNPINAYGRSKVAAEQAVLDVGGDALVVRTSSLFSAHHARNFARRTLQALEDGRAVRAVGDRFLSPTYLPDLCDAMLNLLVDGETGIWHLASTGRVSSAQFAQALAEGAGFESSQITSVSAYLSGWKAPRPVDVSLGSARGELLPGFQSAIIRFLAAHRSPEEIRDHAPARREVEPWSYAIAAE